MTVGIPPLNDTEQMLALELLWVFLDTPWRNWTCCDGTKRPFIWQFAKRREYKEMVARAKERMEAMVEENSFPACFFFGRVLEVLHAINYRKDFCERVKATFPMRRVLYMGNGALRGGMITPNASSYMAHATA